MKTTLRPKMISGLGVIVSCTLATGLLGVKLVGDVRDTDRQTAQRSQYQLILASKIQFEGMQGQAAGAAMADPRMREQALQTLIQVSTQAAKDVAELGRQDLSPDVRALLVKISDGVSTWNKAYNTSFRLSLPVANPNVPTIDMSPAGIAMASKLNIDQQAWSQGLLDQVAANARAAQAKAARDASNQLSLLLWIVGVVSAGILVLGVVFTHRLVRRTRAMANALGRVAKGDLTARVAVKGTDEVAQMAASLNTALGTMHDVVSQLEDEAEQIESLADRTARSTDATGRDDVAHLNEMAANLTAMTGLFVINRDIEAAAATGVPAPDRPVWN